MKRTKPRKAQGSYHSPVREEQARETRRRIENAARGLLLERGFDAMTMDGVAQGAGVAAPTVYAAFGSKLGIVRALLDRARFGPGYRELLRNALSEPDPVARLAYAARIARQVYDAERAEVNLFTTAASLSADIAETEREHEAGRYQAQGPLVKLLADAGVLRLEERQARDVLWALTGRELYRLLVVERGWSSDEYERWLSHQIESALLLRRRRGAAGAPARKRS
jgi:AcrR family transcriptional regulator